MLKARNVIFIKIIESSDVMTIGMELKQLCEEFISVLYRFNEKGIISKEELDICLEKKISFIEEFSAEVE